jgi:hypothetical protein
MLCRGRRRPGLWRWPTALRRLSRLAPPAPAPADPVVVRVDANNVARLGAPKPRPRPRQLLSLPPFPAGQDPLPGRKVAPRRVTAVSWVKHYFADVPQEAVQAHFNRRMVSLCFCPLFGLAFLTAGALFEWSDFFFQLVLIMNC